MLDRLPRHVLKTLLSFFDTELTIDNNEGFEFYCHVKLNLSRVSRALRGMVRTFDCFHPQDVVRVRTQFPERLLQCRCFCLRSSRLHLLAGLHPSQLILGSTTHPETEVSWCPPVDRLAVRGNPDLPRALPVKVLDLWGFCQPLRDVPLQLLSLRMDVYNDPLPPLPQSLQRLELGHYDLPFEPNALPPSLRKLKLLSFNRPLAPGSLPTALTDLALFQFDLDLMPGVLPASLSRLVLYVFDRAFREGALPPRLTFLECMFFNKPIPEGILPAAVKEVHLPHCRHWPQLSGPLKQLTLDWRRVL
ncbi:MAG: uncharacterized protein KVP18_001395 [Porospora cf. gigantea A]|uniref:uncharacterized protein n=1 Tax=Porospora cf. gigantea A TaxID=2853593 RepID=UPI0035594C4E|nr:MAG: hypothetical protein KVP18_001395 [Porospora cf. gigantea A]